MKGLLVVNIVALCNAFILSPPPTAFKPSRFSTPVDSAEEGAGLDLDLDEMFQMFDAAAKDEDFDAAVEKIKKED